jgi:Fe2+ or Zn2+ uptake regulation protein
MKRFKQDTHLQVLDERLQLSYAAVEKIKKMRQQRSPRDLATVYSSLHSTHKSGVTRRER